MTDDISLDETENGIFSHFVFYKTHISAKADNTSTEKNWFAESLADTQREFYIEKFLAESLISP